MASVSIRDLRNHDGDVVDRAASGEVIKITRSGKPVASLRAADAQPMPAETLLARWRSLPPLDPDELRRDIDAALDPEL